MILVVIVLGGTFGTQHMHRDGFPSPSTRKQGPMLVFTFTQLQMALGWQRRMQ